MIHNWTRILKELIENRKVGDWNSALYQLINESYKQLLDEEDREVLCVLIVLHSAIKKEISLDQLAKLCIDYENTKLVNRIKVL